MKKRLLKFGLLIITILLVVAAVGYAARHYYTGSSSEPVQVDETLVSRAVDAIANDNKDELAKVADEITSIGRHEEVPEYVYVLALHYLQQEDVDNAEKYIELFRATDAEADYVGAMAGMRHADMVKNLDNRMANLKIATETPRQEEAGAWADQ